MAVPRNRHSNARKNKRRSHMAKKQTQTLECSNCKADRIPHHVCASCGQYAGRQVITVSSETE